MYHLARSLHTHCLSPVSLSPGAACVYNPRQGRARALKRARGRVEVRGVNSVLYQQRVCVCVKLV